MSKKVAVGLSGGIDSSVAAYLLKERGYEVVGFTLKFFPEENRCCDLDSLYLARQLCHALEIPHYTLDVGDFFRGKVIDYFIESYLKGVTPNPCAYCNRFIKFGRFFEKVRSLGIDYLATGHYADIIPYNDTLVIAKNKDTRKSQEYFLSLVEPQVLPHLLFPLAKYTKDEVKHIARSKELLCKDRKESQDVCFVQDKSYPEFIRENTHGSHQFAGQIRHIGGKVLGRHQGIYHYTYGQRGGLGVGWRAPLYVADIDCGKREVIVAEKEYLLRDSFSVRSLNWFYRPSNKAELAVRVRYNSGIHACSLTYCGEKINVRLHKKISGVAPGQVAVFYDKNAVLGGGIIDKEVDI